MSDASHDKNNDNAEPLDSVVSRAVELGYKVIEEQIQQGRHVAEQLTRGDINAGMVNGNMSEVVNRVMRFYSDMGALWFEMLESVVRNPNLGEWMQNFSPARENKVNGAQSNGAPQSADRPAVHVEVVSPEPVGARVSVDLHSDCRFGTLVAEALHARGTNHPPLTGVRFIAAAEHWPASIRVTVPAGQGPGNYSGLILNTLTDEPVGTLLVHLPERRAEQ